MRSDDIVVELVRTLAAAEGVPPTELPYTLTDYIDPMAIRSLVAGGGDGERLSFTVEDHRITVVGTGDIVVDEDSEASAEMTLRPGGNTIQTTPTTLLPTGDDLRLDPTYFERSTIFPDLCFVLDEDGIYQDILVKPDQSALLYREPEELLGNSVDEKLPKQEAETIGSAIAATLASDEVHSYFYELSVPAGTREFAARSHPMESAGERRCVLLTVSDVTEDVETMSKLTN